MNVVAAAPRLVPKLLVAVTMVRLSVFEVGRQKLSQEAPVPQDECAERRNERREQKCASSELNPTPYSAICTFEALGAMPSFFVLTS